MLKKLKSRAGQSMVEFAICLPVLLAILCGILDFGWIYSQQYKLQYAAFQGTRYATINSPMASSDPDAYSAGIQQRVIDNSSLGANVIVVVEDEKVTVTATQDVKTLTFVAGTIFGDYYHATATNVAAF